MSGAVASSELMGVAEELEGNVHVPEGVYLRVCDLAKRVRELEEEARRPRFQLRAPMESMRGAYPDAELEYRLRTCLWVPSRQFNVDGTLSVSMGADSSSRPIENELLTPVHILGECLERSWVADGTLGVRCELPHFVYEAEDVLTLAFDPAACPPSTVVAMLRPVDRCESWYRQVRDTRTGFAWLVGLRFEEVGRVIDHWAGSGVPLPAWMQLREHVRIGDPQVVAA